MSLLDELKALERGLSERRQDWQGFKPPGTRTPGPKLQGIGRGENLPQIRRAKKSDPR